MRKCYLKIRTAGKGGGIETNLKEEVLKIVSQHSIFVIIRKLAKEVLLGWRKNANIW